MIGTFTKAIAALGTPVSIWAAVGAVRYRHWTSLVAVLGFALSSIACAFTPGHPRGRAWWTMINFAILVWVTTPLAGMHGGAGALAVGVAVIAGLMFPTREAVVLPAILVGGLLLWGVLLAAGAIARPPRVSSDAGETGLALRSIAVTVGVTSVTVLAISYLVQKLTRTLFEAERSLQRRREAEAELIRAQKLETLGRVAGGVAHDVNNNLTVMLAGAELIERAEQADDRVRQLAASILDACHSASLLTRQLLTLGRRDLARPERVDVASTLSRIERLLRATLGRGVKLTMTAAPNLPPVHVDPRQLEQVILNLAINARDALPYGGSIAIRAEHGGASPDYRFATSDRAPSDAVRVHVEDDGTGIDEQVLPGIFDFFFTTKAREGGTGLGLAVTRAFAEASGGRVGVRTTLGKGSIFTLELPAAAREIARPSPPARAPKPATILVVDDDARVRTGIVEVLRAEGHAVLEAADGVEALERARSTPSIDLLCTDAVMPRLGGEELIRRFAPLHPEARVLVCSAYTHEPGLRELVRSGRYAALPKPFTPSELREAVARVLSAPSAAAAAEQSQPSP